MFSSVPLAEAILSQPQGPSAHIGIMDRPAHPDAFARYLVYATVEGIPWSAVCRSIEEAQTQARAWRDGLLAEGYTLADPFGPAAPAPSHVATVCSPEWRMAREK